MGRRPVLRCRAAVFFVNLGEIGLFGYLADGKMAIDSFKLGNSVNDIDKRFGGSIMNL